MSAAGSAMAGRHRKMPQPGYPPVVRHCSRRMRERALRSRSGCHSMGGAYGVVRDARFPVLCCLQDRACT